MRSRESNLFRYLIGCQTTIQPSQVKPSQSAKKKKEEERRKRDSITSGGREREKKRKKSNEGERGEKNGGKKSDLPD